MNTASKINSILKSLDDVVRDGYTRTELQPDEQRKIRIGFRQKILGTDDPEHAYLPTNDEELIKRIKAGRDHILEQRRKLNAFFSDDYEAPADDSKSETLRESIVRHFKRLALPSLDSHNQNMYSLFRLRVRDIAEELIQEVDPEFKTDRDPYPGEHDDGRHATL